MRVRLHPKARVELIEARNWYHDRSPLSSAAFSHAVDRAISRIRESPNSFPIADHGTRKFVLQRFPFSIFYRIGEIEIVIVSGSSSKAKARLLVGSCLTVSKASRSIFSRNVVASVPTDDKNGAPGAIPTRDLSLRRRALYATELREHMRVNSKS